MTTNPNSRKVTIFRKSNFAEDAQKATALDFVSQSRKSIGSYWEKSTAKAIGSGLSFEEQKILMPQIIDCEVADRQFRQKVSEYFASIKTSIPYEKGLTLEIGLEEDNSKPVSVTNQPINLHEYITYRHAIGHPHVATSKAAADGNPLIEYYIHDESAVEEAGILERQNRDKAMGYYLKVTQEPKKIDMLLTLLNEDPREYSGKNSESKKLQKLDEIARSRPSDFVEAYDKKHFEELYVVQSLINTGIWKESGSKVIDADDLKIVGNTKDEAIAWIKDPENSQKLALLRGRMQEVLAKPVAPKKKKPQLA